jgi:N6-adenosine-specific RNA methylase IME4
VGSLAFEFCLLGFFGKPMLRFTDIGKLNWLETNPVPGKHSAKPDAFYRLVETMSPGPYLDCFARRERTNWTVWGNEVSPLVKPLVSGTLAQ